DHFGRGNYAAFFGGDEDGTGELSAETERTVECRSNARSVIAIRRVPSRAERVLKIFVSSDQEWAQEGTIGRLSAPLHAPGQHVAIGEKDFRQEHVPGVPRALRLTDLTLDRNEGRKVSVRVHRVHFQRAAHLAQGANTSNIAGAVFSPGERGQEQRGQH